MNVAFTNLHPVLQSGHVSLLHQLVERYELSKALSHSHDLSLSGQVQRQLQSRVQPHLPDTATHTRQASNQHQNSQATLSKKDSLFYHKDGIWLMFFMGIVSMTKIKQKPIRFLHEN